MREKGEGGGGGGGGGGRTNPKTSIGIGTYGGDIANVDFETFSFKKSNKQGGGGVMLVYINRFRHPRSIIINASTTD